MMPSEEPAEAPGHSVGGLFFVQALEPGTLESCGIGLKNPGRASGLVLIGVGDKRAPLGFLKDEGEGIERPGRAHPGEHIGANVDLRLEVLDMFFAKTAVDAVGQYYQLGIGEPCLVVDVALEHQAYPHLPPPPLPDPDH